MNNRPIKFRVWDKEKKQMRRVDELHFAYEAITQNGLGVIEVVCRDLGYEEEEITEFELMQFIGLKDKSGNPIYEGDILKFHKNPTGKSKKPYRQLMVVEFSEEKSMFVFHVVGEGQITNLTPWVALKAWEHDGHRCEIIGNIYENPELL